MKAAITIALLLAAVPGLAAEPVGQPHPPEIEKALALRSRLGVSAVAVPVAVLVHSQRAHHLTAELATLATRDARGVWTISSIGEERSGLVAVNPRVIPEQVRALSPSAGAKLDKLLASGATYKERIRTKGQVGIGAPSHTMEIITPERRRVIQWNGRLTGNAGKIADLVLGRG